MHPILLGILVKISNLGRNQKHFVFHTKGRVFIAEFILDIQNLRVLKLLSRAGSTERGPTTSRNDSGMKDGLRGNRPPSVTQPSFLRTDKGEDEVSFKFK